MCVGGVCGEGGGDAGDMDNRHTGQNRIPGPASTAESVVFCVSILAVILFLIFICPVAVIDFRACTTLTIHERTQQTLTSNIFSLLYQLFRLSIYFHISSRSLQKLEAGRGGQEVFFILFLCVQPLLVKTKSRNRHEQEIRFDSVSVCLAIADKN